MVSLMYGFVQQGCDVELAWNAVGFSQNRPTGGRGIYLRDYT